jgi:hypothetical protein
MTLNFAQNLLIFCIFLQSGRRSSAYSSSLSFSSLSSEDISSWYRIDAMSMFSSDPSSSS